jgi:hypothetical protein
MHPACEPTRVIKKFAPHQPGAIKFARRYGRPLLCVRHRESLDGSIRYITVELLVDQLPTFKRQPDTETVAIELRPDERELRQRIRENYGVWDPRSRVWRLPRGLARRLRLMSRLIAK